MVANPAEWAVHGSRRVFLATDVRHEGEPEAAEASRVAWLPVGNLPKLIASGQITDGPSLTALAVYLALPR